MRSFLIGCPQGGDVWTHEANVCRKRVRRWVVLAFLLGLSIGLLGCAAKQPCPVCQVCEEWWPCPPCPPPYEVKLLEDGSSPTEKETNI